MACISVQTSVWDEFRDVPANAWFFNGIREIRDAKISYYEPFGCFAPKGSTYLPSRYELAICTYSSLEGYLAKIEVEKSPSLRPAFLQRHRGLVQFFDRATREFSRELAEMGLSWKVELARLKPFTDVPVGHWASQSVRDLKVLGLISGYPDGMFRG